MNFVGLVIFLVVVFVLIILFLLWWTRARQPCPIINGTTSVANVASGMVTVTFSTANTTPVPIIWALYGTLNPNIPFLTGTTLNATPNVFQVPVATIVQNGGYAEVRGQASFTGASPQCSGESNTFLFTIRPSSISPK